MPPVTIYLVYNYFMLCVHTKCHPAWGPAFPTLVFPASKQQRESLRAEGECMHLPLSVKKSQWQEQAETQADCTSI